MKISRPSGFCVVNDCPSALESCFELIEGLPDDYQQHFWQQFSETPLFPLQFFQVLQFVDQNLSTQAHSIVFDTLLRMGQDENLSEEHRSAIMAIIHFYFPDDKERGLVIHSDHRNFQFKPIISSQNCVKIETPRQSFRKLADHLRLTVGSRRSSARQKFRN
jgi:hypothetical protein